MSSHRPPLTSNDEHARTIDPVLTRDAAVWIHEDLPAPPLTVIGGRVFSYRDLLYDPLDAPLLKIRPIDDGQHIPFLARVVLQPKSPISHETAVNLSLPAPPIFNPRVTDVNAWVEAALPTREGDLHWFVIDPTLAGTTTLEAERSSFVQFEDRILLYPFRPTISVAGLSGRRTTDVLLNWRRAEETLLTGSAQLDRFIDSVVEGVDRHASRMAEDLVERGLLLRRQSSTIVGSPYVLVDRPATEKGDSRLQLRLENEERLVLELAASVGNALERKTDLETIERLSRAYSDLNGLFFAGAPAHRNLELVYARDRHTDRLRSVSLIVGRYLVEHHLDRILKRLSNNRLLTKEETAELSEIAKATGGKNLYVLQELARQHDP
jgi:hypothetical protein